MILEAKYVRRSICPCGYGLLHDDIPLGAVYLVDLNRKDTGAFICGRCHTRTPNLQLIWAESTFSGEIGWLPLEILDIAKVN